MSALPENPASRPRRRAALNDAITDVAGILVGHWTDRANATGCTVVLCPEGTVGGVDVRGAAPGTRETELLRPGNLVERVDAILLAGGSAFGLDAAGGVMQYLLTQGRGFPYATGVVPIVPGAILFDLGLKRAAWPDADAGYRAAEAARRGRVSQGSVGAGTGATVAKMAGIERAWKGGIGTASELLDTGIVVGALAAVNAVGSIRDSRAGAVVAAPRDDDGQPMDVDRLLRLGRGRRQVEEDVAERGAEAVFAGPEGVESPSNTTLAVVATNAKLTKAQVNRIATVAHDGFARSIWPVHTRADGDVIFALATGEQEITDDQYPSIEAMSALAVERAVLAGVRAAKGLGGVPGLADAPRKSRGATSSRGVKQK
ncbi:MAG: P1 family peptidase [Dehalococcoidia bacterium]|nr:P1 family peptidase [Dehalococcoidia bacterium]